MPTPFAWRRLALDGLVWGFLLWLAGFALGMVAYPFVPTRWIGLVVLPIMLPVTVWVAWRRLRGHDDAWTYPAAVGLLWGTLAVGLDWAILVRGFAVTNYYDADILAYYVLAFAIPVGVWAWLRRGGRQQTP